jgi:hypothetical protein
MAFSFQWFKNLAIQYAPQGLSAQTSALTVKTPKPLRSGLAASPPAPRPWAQREQTQVGSTGLDQAARGKAFKGAWGYAASHPRHAR